MSNVSQERLSFDQAEKEQPGEWITLSVAEYQRLQAIEAERDRYKAALEFYAEHKNWELPGFGRGHSPVVTDRGERARNALKGADTK